MLKLEYKDYTLDFKFEAGTSRGVLRQHPIYLVRVTDSLQPGREGIGEAAPLEKLSSDRYEELQDAFIGIQKKLPSLPFNNQLDEVPYLVKELVDDGFPSIKFALEMALYDLINGGKRMIFDNGFYHGKTFIPINGLIWMGDPEFMRKQIDEKLAMGSKCIKLKIGAIDFEEEVKLLEYIRSKSADMIMRVDANGAFKNNEAFARLNALEPFGLHSIEQPIMPGQMEAMQLICQKSPVPIALDEELIGITERSQKQEILKLLKPHYLVLKPTLLGGFAATEEWIRIADQLGVGWWMTSALESNVGLNAIAQFTARFDQKGHQGLGTGQLYTNNFESPLSVDGQFLNYDDKRPWKIDF